MFPSYFLTVKGNLCFFFRLILQNLAHLSELLEDGKSLPSSSRHDHTVSNMCIYELQPVDLTKVFALRNCILGVPISLCSVRVIKKFPVLDILRKIVPLSSHILIEEVNLSDDHFTEFHYASLESCP